MSKIQYLFWDVDRTLLDFEVYEQAAFQYACEKYHIMYTKDWYSRCHDISLSLWEKHEKGEIEKEELIYLRFKLLFEEMGIEADEYTFEHTYQEQLAEGCHYIDGAMDILEYCAGNYHMYIVSNGVTETQIKKINTSGIDKYMDQIFISGEIGCQKPSKEFFEACFDRIPGFQKDAAIIIGDSLTADIRGGNNAGIKTCWFNPRHIVCNENVAIDMEIHELTSLKGLL